jgi:6-phosphogluconolactonase (cycloisomerase 2 family)
VRVFTIAANAIAEISGSPYSSGGTGPSSILPASDGNYVYVANDAVSGSSIGNIASFSVSSTNSSYSLSSISTASTGYVPLSLAADSSGNFLLVANSGGSPDLEAYTMSSGTLTSVLTASTGTDPVKAIAIAVAP